MPKEALSMYYPAFSITRPGGGSAQEAFMNSRKTSECDLVSVWRNLITALRTESTKGQHIGARKSTPPQIVSARA
jgi:hypothetical protein